jgi:DnaK suppressor protein
MHFVENCTRHSIPLFMNISEIRLNIEKEILKTERLIAEYKQSTEPIAPDVAIGRISRMDAINNKSVVEAALRQAEDKLEKLRYVLTKVESPEFGICLKCHKPIPLGRILIRPESLYCVNCAR